MFFLYIVLIKIKMLRLFVTNCDSVEDLVIVMVLFYCFSFVFIEFLKFFMFTWEDDYV